MNWARASALSRHVSHLSRTIPNQSAGVRAGPACPAVSPLRAKGRITVCARRAEGTGTAFRGNMMASERPEYVLPGVIGIVADQLGEGAALRLAGEFGGQRLYIDRFPRQDHKIARAVGMEISRVLSAEFGGENIEIPRAAAVVDGSIYRRDEILSSSESVNSLARRLGCTERRVRQVRSSAAGDPRQWDIFKTDRDE